MKEISFEVRVPEEELDELVNLYRGGDIGARIVLKEDGAVLLKALQEQGKLHSVDSVNEVILIGDSSVGVNTPGRMVDEIVKIGESATAQHKGTYKVIVEQDDLN